ncbi:hypothetical protein [Sansalvadorimonas verongulae]|uniref:hypothetical protein n=1 Tax=Sansalvadorimonas verongulae TaxID=2172824 RepID=UPI0012BD2A38|nr:hypothetical protein [Sansalvadorimonas verongulae]MTI13773.1 hypothetical protein [Sansalvadorimonas verongulae]
MSMLHRTRHLLAPLSALLLGNPAIALAETETVAEPSAPESVQVTSKGARLTADSEGQLHLRVDHSLLTSQPDDLKNALLEVVLNNHSHLAPAGEIDSDGKIHYLVRLGRDEAGTDIRLKPISLDSPVTRAISDITTGAIYLISMKVADYSIKYRSEESSPRHFTLDSQAGESIHKEISRNHLRQGILLSVLNTGEAISTLGSHMLGRKPGEDRPNLLDPIPDIASTAVMGMGSILMQTDGLDWLKTSTWDQMITLYATSSATNTFSRAIKRTTESVFHDLTGWGDTTSARAGQAAQILISSALLAGLNRYTNFKPGGNPEGTTEGSVWGQNYLTNSLAITVVYNARELTADLVSDLTGSQTLADFTTSGLMATGAGIMQAISRAGWNMADHTYRATTAFVAAEAAGVSLGYGLKKAVNGLLGDEKSTTTRVARVGSSVLAAFALKGFSKLAANYIPGGDAMRNGFINVVSPMGDGVIISNMFDIMSLTSEVLVEPWVVKPIANRIGLTNPEKTPVLRLRATALRRPLIEGPQAPALNRTTSA